MQVRLNELEDEIDEKNTRLESSERIKLKEEQFRKLVKTVGLQMKNGSFVQKDIITQTLFTKLIIDNQNKLTTLRNPEFDGLIYGLNPQPSLYGESGGIRTLDTGLKRPVL